MRYLGSKTRIKNDLYPFLTEHLDGKNEFVDAFMGGANVIDKLPYDKKVGIELNQYVCSIWKRIQKDGVSWIPQAFDEDDYYKVKLDYKWKDHKNPKELIGYVGNCLSYGSKWWGGFAKYNPKKKEDHVLEAYNGIKKQVESFEFLNETKFINCSYDEYEYKPNSVIYCDPPYAQTIKYESDFNHAKFWEWVRKMTLDGHYVYVSEYDAPYDMKCIWRKAVNEQVGKNTNQKVEKLFIYPKKKVIF